MERSTPKTVFQKSALASAIGLALTAPLSVQAAPACESPETPSFVVNSTLDVVDSCDNLTTLREAVNHANETPGTDDITFDSTVTGTIELTSGPLYIYESLNIVGKTNADELELKSNAPLLIGEYNSPVKDITVSGVTLTSTAEVPMIIMDGYGGTVSLDNIKVNADSVAHSLIQASARSYTEGKESTQPANLKLSLKNSTITGANFSNDVIRGYLRDEAAKGHIEILDTQVVGVTSANGGFAKLETKYGSSSDLNIVAERSTVSGGQWGQNVFEASNEYEASTANVTLTDATVTGNTITGLTVALADSDTASVAITRSQFKDNTVPLISLVGGMNPKIEVRESTVTGNTIQYGAFIAYSGGKGSGTDSTIVVDSTISDNKANSSSNFSMINIFGGTNNTLSGNRIENNEMGAVTVSAKYGTTAAVIENSTIAGNKTAAGGGGINAMTLHPITLNLQVRNTTISGNSANESGAGISAFAQDSGELNLTVSNSTISGNVSGVVDGADTYGGGIFLNENEGGGKGSGTVTATIANTTIIDNSSTGYGGGLVARPGVEASISNSIVAANVGGYVNNNDLLGIFASVQNTLIQDNSTNGETTINAIDISLVGSGEGQIADVGNNLLGVDAKLSELKLVAGSWIHELLADSPAIAAGNAAAADLPATEQRGEGFARVRETAEGNELDLGAVQYFVNPVAVADSTSFSLDVGNATINVLANDAQSSGAMGLDIASVVVMTAPDNGTVEVQEDGSIVYTVIGDYVGDDSFTYVVNDLSGYTSNEATVTVTITEKASEVTGHKKDSGSISLFILGLIGFVGARRLRRKI